MLRGSLDMLFLYIVFFNTTIQIFASVSQPELLCDWHIRCVTAYRTVQRDRPRGASQHPRIQLCCPKEEKAEQVPRATPAARGKGKQ